MDIRIGRRKGTGLDGFPTTIFVLTDSRDEQMSVSKWWYTWEEAEAERARLSAETDPAKP